MVELTTGKCTVKRGDCAWKAAKENLKNNGQKITNAEIAKEMQRLAKLNGCDSVEDFNNKFFSKIGNEYITGNKSSSEKVIPEPKKENDTIKHKREEFLQDSITKPDATRVARPVTKMPINNEPILSAKEAEMKRINEIQDDTSKIIEYNKKNAKGNYVIVDKKSCKATVYNKDGKALESYEILLGQDKGDDLSTAYAKDPSKRTYTTVPGEYEITGEKTTFGGTYHLGGVNYIFDPDVEMRSDAPGSGGKKKFGGAYLALHGTANPKVRNKYYDNGNLADNRQSMGCVNIPVDKLKEMEAKYGISVGSSVYILPEDKGNSLVLQEQLDGTVKFITHYADNVQNKKLAKINDTIAQKNIAKREQQERLLAQQKAEDFSWYNPRTWFV